MHSICWLSEAEESLWGPEIVSLSGLSRQGIPTPHALLIHPNWFIDIFENREVRNARRALERTYVPGTSHVPGELSDLRTAVKNCSIQRKVSKHFDSYIETFRYLHFVEDNEPIALFINTKHIESWHSRRVEVTDSDDLCAVLRDVLYSQLRDQEVAHRLDRGESLLGLLPALMVTDQPIDNVYTVRITPEDGTVLEVLDEGGSLGHWDRRSLLPLRVTSPRRQKNAISEDIDSLLSLSRDAFSVLPIDISELELSRHGSSFKVCWVSGLASGVSGYLADARPQLASGVCIIPGVRSGIVRYVSTAAQRRGVIPGEVVVVPSLRADNLGWLAGAAALITEEPLSPSKAIVETLRRLGMPVLYVPLSRFQIANSQMVTVDATRGMVFPGLVSVHETKHQRQMRRIETATPIMRLLQDPLTAEGETLGASDGIGLLRGEFLLDALGARAKDVLAAGHLQEYGEVLHGILSNLFRTTYPHPLYYQLHDSADPSRRRAVHGARALLQTPHILATEIAVLAELVKQGSRHVSIVIPSVRSIDELDDVLAILNRLWPKDYDMPDVLVRVGSVALAMRPLALLGREVRGLVIDCDALAEQLSGYDAHHHTTAHMIQYDDAALIELMYHVIETSTDTGAKVALLSETRSIHESVLEMAVRAGVSSITVPVSEVSSTRRLVNRIEKGLILEAARK